MSYSSTVLAESSLIAYWRLGSSPTTDSKGSHTLTDIGSPTSSAGLLIGDSDTCRDFPGDMSKEYKYTGAALSDFDFLNVAAFSIEAWVNLDTVDGDFRRIVSHEDGTNGWALEYHNTAGFLIARSGGGVTKTASEAAGGLVQCTTGQTFYVVGTYDGSALRIYVNGTLRTGGDTTSDNWTLAVSEPLRTGVFAGTAQIDGRIDEIAVYNAALSQVQVTSHYESGIGLGVQTGVAFLAGVGW